jgi:hypothetical protein
MRCGCLTWITNERGSGEDAVDPQVTLIAALIANVDNLPKLKIIPLQTEAVSRRARFFVDAIFTTAGLRGRARSFPLAFGASLFPEMRPAAERGLRRLRA